MTKVVAQLNDFTSEEQDAINQELKWLFVAADHFSKIRRGEIDATAPIRAKYGAAYADIIKRIDAVQ